MLEAHFRERVRVLCPVGIDPDKELEKDAAAQELFQLLAGLLALEYELNEKDPVDDIKACLEVAREACKKL